MPPFAIPNTTTTVRMDDRVPRGHLWFLGPDGRPIAKGTIEDMTPLPMMPGLDLLIALNPLDAKIMVARAKQQGHAVYPSTMGPMLGGRQ